MTDIKQLKRLACLFLVSIASLCAGCDSAPVYSGLQVGGFDYTHRVINDIVIEDQRGEKISIGSPGGDGSLSCCAKIKGRQIKVSWVYSHFHQKSYRDGKKEETRTAMATLPLVDESFNDRNKLRFLYIHIFPDEHVELDVSNEMFGHDRFPSYDVAEYLLTHDVKIMAWRDALESAGPGYSFHRLIYKIAGSAYIKYGLTEKSDLLAYVSAALKVSPTFDEHEKVLPLLKQSKGHPGRFSELFGNIPEAEMDLIRAKNPATTPLPIEEER